MVSAGLSAPTASGAGIAASTLSPAASYEIGQYFKGKDAEGSAAHILAHTILGAAVAATGGNNALSAGIAAGGAEAAAPLLAEYLYGKKAKDLTASEKSTISSIVGLAGSAVGTTTGDVSNIVQGGQSAQNAVENNALENVLMPHEIDEIKNDKTGQYTKEQLQAIKDNSTYKINEDGDFIVCIKVAGSSCAPRVGERYATQKEILEKSGETVATTAVSWGAAKILEPIVVVVSKSGVWTKVTGTVKGWFGKNNDIGESTRSITNIENDILDTKRVGYGEKGSGSGNKVDQISREPVIDKDGNKIPVHIKADGSAMGNKFAEQEFPSVPRAHGFNDIIDNYAGQAKKTTLSNGASLYQIEGSMNGTVGRFEWIVDPKLGGVSHRMFIPNGKITGVPTKP